jgi:hypothetical protein
MIHNNLLSRAKRTAVFGMLGALWVTQCLAAESMVIVPSGQVGIGTSAPEATLNVLADDTTVGEGNAVVKLSKEGGLAFQLDDTSVTGFWNFSAALGESEFRISRSGTGNTEMKLTETGDLTIFGQLITGGPMCDFGCDYVFNPAYELPSIEEHAEQMWKDKYLPAIGPTIPTKPVNISDQFGNVLNELETAHIYIAQLNDEKKALNSKVESLESRLSQLEAFLNQ